MQLRQKAQDKMGKNLTSRNSTKSFRICVMPLVLLESKIDAWIAENNTLSRICLVLKTDEIKNKSTIF
jgi:hypothetical protein